MKQPETLSEVIAYTFRAKVVEPVRRVKDLDHVPRGHRAGAPSPRHVSHRFPIKGGVSRAELLAQNIYASNALFKQLSRRRP